MRQVEREGMGSLYTLPEIARLTGIPLAELEEYERDFADVLPPPQVSPADPVKPAARRPRQKEAGRMRPGTRWKGWGVFRRAWGRVYLAARRVRWWPLIAVLARVLMWWRRWRSEFEPA